MVAGPGRRRQRRLGRRGRAGRALPAAGVGLARAGRRAARLPRGPSALPRRAAARDRAGRPDARGHDLVLVAGSSVFPYYPYIPGPPLPEGAELVAITSDPDEAARAPMGDAIVADVKLTLEALVAAVGESDRPAPEPLGDPPPVEDSDPLSPSAVHATLREVLPETGSSCSSRPRSTLALRNRLRISRPGSYFFGAGGGLGYGLAAGVGVQLAQPDRPVVCVLGEGSAQYAISGFWTAVAYKVPVTFLVLRNDEYGILKWFAEIEQVTGAPGLDLPALETAAIARGYGVRLAPCAGATSCARRSTTAIGVERARAGRGGGHAGHGSLLADPWPLRSRHPRSSRRPTAFRTSSRPARRSRCARELEALLGADRVLARVLDLVRYASDASPYRLIPQAVVMARDADDVAKVLAYGRRAECPVTLRSGGTSLNGQGQGDGILVDVRAHFAGFRVEEGGERVRVRPGHGARPRQPRAAPARPPPRPRPGVDRLRHRRRRDRQQLGRDALRRAPRLLLDRALADLRAAVGNDDRHRGTGRGRALRGGRARAGARARGDPRRDPRRRRAERAHPAQVRDQEHDRLPAVRVPRRRRAGRDLPPPAGRLGGHARVHRRGGARHRAARPPRDDRRCSSSRHRRRLRAGARRWSRRARPRSS